MRCPLCTAELPPPWPGTGSARCPQPPNGCGAGVRVPEVELVPEWCGRCGHRPFLHRRGDLDCSMCGCPGVASDRGRAT